MSDEQRVPQATIASATTLKTRMLKLLDYFFANDTEIAAELASIRSGTGYQDTANDLVRLAALYDQQADAIRHESKHYRADDAAAARKLAELIVISLVAAANDTRVWQDRRDRAWTYLQMVYKEVCAAGSFVYRGTDDAARFGVKLVSTARAQRRRASRTPAAPSPAPVPTPAPVSEMPGTTVPQSTPEPYAVSR